MFYVNGTMQTQLTLKELSAQLVPRGIAVELRESHNYSSGQYLRLKHNDAHVTLERTGPEEYILRADAESYPILLAVCNNLSRHFSAADIPHKIEIYDESDELLHQCPP